MMEVNRRDSNREEMPLPLEGPFHEALRARLRVAIVASLILNVFLWRAASGFVRKQVFRHATPVEITRVIIDKQNRVTQKVVKKEQIKKRVAEVKKKIE